MRSNHHSYRSSTGFTLLEMIIVVAVLALVASLSWPSLRKLSQKRELLESARQVRVALLRTRLEAIETSTFRQFHYQPGTGAFESTVFSPEDDPTDQTGPSPDAALPGELEPDPQSATGSTDRAESPEQPALPDGVFFVDPEAANPLDTEPLDTGDDESVEDSNIAWSTPILFYPNGRTLNAHLRLSDGQYVIDVTLRGLTGTVRIGKVQRVVESGDEMGRDMGEEPGGLLP